jgi:hypothetical protein
MGLIQAAPGELSSVGSEIEGIAPSVGTLAAGMRGVGGAVSEPSVTAAALADLASTWSAASARLEDDVAALGRALGASAVAYRTADDTSMSGGVR